MRLSRVMKSDGKWVIRDGKPRAKKRPRNPLAVVERLEYNNPYGYDVERVWFNGKIIFASEQGELDIDETRVKVAQEYQIVYSVALGRDGKLKGSKKPRRVAGQLNIYDSVPGMKKYSPIWQFNYVIVPKGYKANTLRSEKDCLDSGYEIKRSRVFEN
ncbi:MAG TPA: hypothetical protein VEU77_13700 [Candidatus Acidoferrales bacterium]|nr:hypothetical protein [Candidatus Acidoferrales bacterium]